MNLFGDKMCNICLKQSDTILRSYENKILYEIPVLKQFLQQIQLKSLCVWCVTALKKISQFLALIQKSQKLLHDHQIKSKMVDYRPHNLSIYTNESIHIEPFTKVFVEEVKDELFYNEHSDGNNKNVTIKKERNKILTSVLSKNKHYSLTKLPDVIVQIFVSVLEILQKSQNSIYYNIVSPPEKLLQIHDGLEGFYFKNHLLILKQQWFRKRRQGKKQSVYSDMKYKVEFLSVEQQRREIERRKKSLKYKERLYKCEECGLGFLTGDVFQDHQIRHTMVSGKFVCKICSLRFKSKAVLSQHILLHSRMFICTLCGTRIKKWSHAVAHRHKCGSVCVKACIYCAKLFGNEHSLQVHIKGHTKDNKYECTECKRRFGTKQRLRVHTRLHTGFRPFKCDCGKQFTTKSNLKSHQNVHSLLRNHYCVECNTTYKTERGLKKHLAESVKHARDRQTGFSCSHCNKTFLSETTLNSHQRVRHLTLYTCDICNKNFSSNSNLRKHIRCIHKTEVL